MWDRRMARVVILLLVATALVLGIVGAPGATASADAPTKLHLSWDRDPKTTMTTQWQTSGATTGDYCEYGLDTQYGSRSSFNTQFTYSGASGQQHVARIENLTAGTQYHFRCGDPTGGVSPDGVFSTSPSGSADFSFVAMGDMGDVSTFRLNVDNIDANVPFPDFFVSTGDNMYDDGANQAGWDSWFGKWQPPSLKGLALMPSLGNHDVGGGGRTNYKGQFALPGVEDHYGWRYGEMAFYAFDSNVAVSPSSQQYQQADAWFTQQKATGARWLAAYMHHPMYSSGSHGSDMTVRSGLQPMFDRLGVDLVLQGHDHNYQRSYIVNNTQVVDGAKSLYKDPKGRMYVVTGGGGQSLYDPGAPENWQAVQAQTYHYSEFSVFANGSLRGKAIDTTKRVIDEFWIVKTGGGGQNNAPAVPTLAGPSSGQTNQTLSYDVQGTDPDNDQVKYTVDWGDTKTDTSSLVNSGTKHAMPHAWTAPGSYQVKAMSTDAKGAVSAWSPTMSVTITGGGVNNSAPAVPTMTGPSTGQAGQSLSFDVKGTDPDNDQVKYTVDWADANSDTSALVNSGATQAMPHVWSAAGTYLVKAMSTDSKGAASAWSTTVSVTISPAPQNNAPPPPALTGPTAVKVGVASSFDVSGTDPDNDQLKYTIDWGDTTSNSGQLVASGTKNAFSHAWSAKGTYNVKAESTDALGLKSGWSAPLTVVVTEETGNPDKEPPVIVHSPVKKAPASKPIAITATVTDNVFVHHVALYWKSESGSWQSTRLLSEPNDKFTGEIPAADVKGSKVFYYLEAADDATNLALSPAAGDSSPYEVEIEQTGGGGGTSGGVLGALSAFAMPILIAIILVVAIIAIAAIAFRRKRRSQPTHPYAHQQPAQWDPSQPQGPYPQQPEWDPNQQGWRQG